MRVHELAKELGVTSREILLLLEELGVGGKTASSTIPPEQMPVIRARLGQSAAAEPAAATPPPPAAQKPRPAPAPAPPAPAATAPPPTPAPAPAAPAPVEEEEEVIRLRAPVSVVEFATVLDMDAENIVSAAESFGETVTEEGYLSSELATLIGEQWGYAVHVEAPAEEEAPAEPEPEPVAVAEPAPAAAPAAPPVTAEEPVVPPVRLRVVPRRVAPPDAPGRPPVVTVLGHVDHGKTTLLDAIRETNVTATEAGQITQHIGAYQVEVNGRTITFIDTPGHEAFTAMRARGAQVTDIAILVVAADDGVMPQTLEAVDHARAAGVPIIVAVNKVDRPNASVEAVKQRLSEVGLVPEEWGGETIYAPLSALQRTGIEELLEMVLLVTDMNELRAERDKPAEGVVLEAELDRRRGPVATLLVQEGLLKVGDAVAIGPVSGKVRAMTDDRGERLKEAGPSTPVQVIGLSDVPEASELFRVVPSEREARVLAETAREEAREAETTITTPRSMAEISRLLAAGEVKTLNLILKADVQGSSEAILAALSQIRSEEVRLEVLHSGVGDVNESDVGLAAASRPTVIIGFQVGAEAPARRLAADEHIEIRRYEVIYDLLDDVRLTMLGMLEAVYEQVTVGRAEVRALFRSSRVGTIAGCYVLEGRATRGAAVRVLRKGQVVHGGTIASLRHLRDDVTEVTQGFECGITLQSFDEFEVGDVIECTEEREVRRSSL
jgi:translation initiation factor IF-2